MQRHKFGKSCDRSAAARRALAAALATTAAALLMQGVAAAQPAGAGREQFIATFTGESLVTENNAPLVAAGTVNAQGTLVIVEDAPHDATLRLAFPEGALIVTIHGDTFDLTTDPRTCLQRLSGGGTFQVTGGDGSYAGASGAGTFSEQVVVIETRDSSGCTDQNTAAGYGLIRMTGTLTVPGV